MLTWYLFLASGLLSCACLWLELSVDKCPLMHFSFPCEISRNLLSALEEIWLSWIVKPWERQDRICHSFLWKYSHVLLRYPPRLAKTLKLLRMVTVAPVGTIPQQKKTLSLCIIFNVYTQTEVPSLRGTYWDKFPLQKNPLLWIVHSPCIHYVVDTRRSLRFMNLKCSLQVFTNTSANGITMVFTY